MPHCRLSTYGTRAISVAGPVCWNSLPDYLKSSDLSFNCFRQQLKTSVFCKYWHQSQHYFSALETLLMRSTNAWYLLTLPYLVFIRDLFSYVCITDVVCNRMSSHSVVTAPPPAAVAAATAPSGCGFSNNSPLDFDATQPSTNIQVRLADGSRWVDVWVSQCGNFYKVYFYNMP